MDKKPEKPPKLTFKPKKSGKVSTTTVFKRTMALLVVIGFGAFGLLIGKLFTVQLVDYEIYQRKAVSQQTRNDIINPARGIIYDRNMKQLAVSATVETVILSPAEIKDEAQAVLISDGLSRILGVDYDTLFAKAQKRSSRYEYAARKIDAATADEVRKFINENELTGAIYLTPDTKRFYPNGNFLSHVLGFTGTDNNGLYGIEYRLDEYLAGQPGRIISAKNGRGVDMPLTYEQYYDAQNGDNIVLTIDEFIQHTLEKYLEETLASTRAQSGVTGIVMDVTNARVLAMATKPDYNLNDPFAVQDETLLTAMSVMDEAQKASETRSYLQKLWVNKAVNDTYEPGSVFKILTGAMALEENLVGAGETFYCGGHVDLPGKTVSCWKKTGHGSQTFTEGVMHSCNMVFVELGRRLGSANFFKYFKAFGLTQKTGIDLPGEMGGSSALYHSESALGIAVQLANSAFGQTFKVTPIQIITAVSAVANGGTLYRPQIVSQILAADGTVKVDYQPEPVRQVVTPETSKMINAALEQVVSGNGGTGRNAYVKGYHVAGKTGTSQKMDKLDENGVASLRVVSFLGYAPANDPKIAVLIIIDEPQTSVVSGGALAAPVVAGIIGDVMPHLNIEPDYTPEEMASLDIYTPDFKNMTLAEAQKRADQDGLTFRVVGDGNTVTDQMPAAGAVVPRSVQMVLYMGSKKPSYDMGVPNIVGMTLSGIQRLLKDSNLYIRPLGLVDYDSKVLSVKQTPAYGETVQPGAVITVEFLDSSLTIE